MGFRFCHTHLNLSAAALSRKNDIVFLSPEGRIYI